LTQLCRCDAESDRFSGFGGFAGALAGYAVAMKQLHPDSELLALYLPLRAKVPNP
jgi:hypothetical protein